MIFYRLDKQAKDNQQKYRSLGNLHWVKNAR